MSESGNFYGYCLLFVSFMIICFFAGFFLNKYISQKKAKTCTDNRLLIIYEKLNTPFDKLWDLTIKLNSEGLDPENDIPKMICELTSIKGILDYLENKSHTNNS